MSNAAYDHQRVETKWKEEWDRTRLYDAEDDGTKPKYYVLDTFVYPSAKGVTIGHYKSFGGMDVIARLKRMQGFNVLHPTGWDTFGLPAENFAIKSGRHPKDITDENRANFVNQYKSAGLSYAWDREINTSDPEYYKWTQWLFLQLYKHGLAYRKQAPADWCPSCQTVLAKEQIVNGSECERCGSQIETKELNQWFFKVSEFKDRLIADCAKLNWEERYINQHRNWLENVRDWCISRQRYWGPPIPIIYCDKCGEVPVPDSDLPVKLPYDVDYRPKGKAPLASSAEFVNTACPKCGGAATHETDTMDTFVSSAWYQFRFTDPHNNEAFASKEALAYWQNVDHYAGTIEHLTAHLVYARFVTKFLHEHSYVPFDEPFPKYTPVGLLVDRGGTKFSKRLGNAPETNELIEKYGGDLLRLSCQFISPYGDISKWGEQDVIGVKRFRDRFWRLFTERVLDKPFAADLTQSTVEDELNELIQAVTENIESMHFNVAISKLMVFVNNRYKEEMNIDTEVWDVFTRLLAPLAPFIAEEMWSTMRKLEPVHTAAWPATSRR